MPIWFVYRSGYDGPASKHVQRLDGPDTLLGWFRAVWRAIPNIKRAVKYGKSLLGTDVHSFASLFRDAAEEGHAPPESDEELHERLESALYVNEFRATADAIQVLTDDDELQMAMYWFTDAFAAAHPERVTWLLRDDWRLPDQAGAGGFAPSESTHAVEPAGTGDGCVYSWDWFWETAADLEDGVALERLPGVRLPGLVPWLLGLPADRAEEAGCQLIYALQPSLLEVMAEGEGMEASFRRAILAAPAEPANWAAYTDWLAERGLPRAEMRLLELAVRRWDGEDALVDVGAHQISVTTPQGDNQYEQWYLFDDVWASGDEVQARSFFAFAGRWDVLSDPSGSE